MAPVALWIAALLLQITTSAPADRVRALIAAGRLQEARQALASLDASSPAAVHLQGVIHFNSREYAQAVDALTGAVAAEAEGSPAHRESVQMLGRSLFLLHRVPEAIPWLERARGSGLLTVETLYMLGNSYIQNRQPDKAQAAFAEMFGFAADSAPARLLTAQMMVRQQLHDLAEKEAARAAELDPKLAGVHYMLGDLAIFRGDLDRGISELQKEIALNPNFAMSYYSLGDAYTRREQWDDAIPQLQKSIWLNPSSSAPYLVLGKAYLKKGELANAEGVLRRAVQLDSQSYTAHYLLGQTLIQAGRTEEGRQMLERSQQLRKEP